MESATALLSQAERDRVEAISSLDRRAQHAIGRACIRLIGSESSDVPPQRIVVALSEAGKPSLADLPGLHVSVAHTGRVVVAAASRQAAVGVDIERARGSTAFMRRAAARLFSEPEAAAAREVSDAELPEWFLTAWTIKEAVGKALGVGISPALRGAVTERRAGVTALTRVWTGPPADSRTAHVTSAPGGGEIIAVALPAPDVAIEPISRLTVADLRRFS